MAQKCQNDSSNSLSREDRSDVDTQTSNRVIDVPVAKSCSSRGASKHGTGLRPTSSGKWGVQIQHPFNKRSKVWLGTYSTAEEATEVYNKKKIEYARLRSKQCKEDASSKVDKPKRRLDASLRIAESDSSTYKPNCIVLALSAKDPPRKKSGISSVQNRPERLSISQKCQNEMTVSLKEDGAGDTPVPKKSRSLGAEKQAGLSITASGKYGVQIRHPVTRSKVWLGSYSTIEEAINVYNTKKLEYASLKQQEHSCVLKTKGKSKCKKLEFNSEFPDGTYRWRVTVRHPMLKHSLLLGSYDESEEAERVYNTTKLELDALLVQTVFPPNVSKYTGVRQSGTGRWMSQIQGPFSRKNKVYLGTFSTAQEAAEAFKRARHEFDAIVSIVNKCNEHNAKKPVLLELDKMPVDERTRVLEIVVQSHSCGYTKSAVTEVQVSPAELEFGMDIIDCYGQLVGEYSRLDDELWLTTPGDDNGGFTNANLELASDPHPKPSLFSFNRSSGRRK